MTPKLLQRLVFSRVSLSTIAIESRALGESVGGSFSQLKHNRIQTRPIHKPAALSSQPQEFVITNSPYATEPKKRYRVVVGVVLSRCPIITRTLHPFEREYYKYQQRLEQARAAPFPVEFYFKKGSIAEKNWLAKESGDGEKKKSKQKKSSESQVESSEIDTSTTYIEETGSGGDLDEKITIASRETEADRINDMTSLDRALQRTLYLIVRKPRKEHAWQFPQGGVNTAEGELLHQAAKRELAEECGENMDVWFVSRKPIGYCAYDFPAGEGDVYDGAKVFFLKAHIFAGQARVDNTEIVEFAWVTKQEMQKYVSPQYYSYVKDMLNDL
ncbi:105_t:CDS:2 [Paraglomus brasilianum]|uniref:Large ribosomal subunit protein mL46 n=1 Tax=Paraglomus brasilianum TaxID=144538 RepID=A0A9N8ZDF4_9GLOM|nr:105_t:CDS:2 [Paraglomus brasilianum]